MPVVFFLPVRYFSCSVMKDHSSIKVGTVQARNRDPLPRRTAQIHVKARICLAGKAYHCCGDRKIPSNKQLFEKDTSFLQEKMPEALGKPSCSPPSATFKIHMVPGRLFLICWTIALCFECDKAILLSGQSYFFSFLLFPREDSV